MHKVPYARQPGYQNTIVVIKKQHFWLGMKKEVAYHGEARIDPTKNSRKVHD
jgi:hypothetical protein